MKILVVKGKSEYDSTEMFLDEMIEEFIELGWEVQTLDRNTTNEKLAPLKKESYDVIFTINGMLLEPENTLGETFFNNGKPIYCTYLMDHPMIHSERLANLYEKIFVLCPDRNHVAYVDKYMKNIWGVAFLPHAGCAGKEVKPYGERQTEVAFFGSYQVPGEIEKSLQDYPEEMQQLMKNLIGKLLENPERTLEAVLEEFVQNAGLQWTEQEFHSVMSELREVDKYVRAYYRDLVIRTLIEAGITVDVYGHGWEKFTATGCENLRLHPAVSFAESLEILGDTKIALNVMPWFKDGSHDRVFSAMLNGAVCLTDASEWLKEIGKEEENIFFYSLKGIRYLPGKVKRILREEELAQKVAKNGKIETEKLHRWKNRADEVQDYLNSIMELPAGEATDSPASPYTPEEQLFLNQVREKTIETLRVSYKALYHLKRQEYLYALRYTTGVIESLGAEIDSIFAAKDFYNQIEPVVDEQGVGIMIGDIMQAMEHRDYVLMADLLELQLIPFLTKLQEFYAMGFPVEIDRKRLEENVEALITHAPETAKSLRIQGGRRTAGDGTIGSDVDEVSRDNEFDKIIEKISKLLEQGYRIEYTSCGLHTLAVDASGTGENFLYYHSNGAVMEEAMVLADSWFKSGVFEYGVIGAGLGYPVQELLEKDESVEVMEVETDANIILLALAFGGLKELFESDRYTLVYDKDLTCLTAPEKGQAEREWCVHYPALPNIQNAFLREQIEDYFISKSSMRTQIIRLDANFARNKGLAYPSVDTLKEEWQGKTLYIIAAGPSLDKNMQELKKVGEDGIILATGTVLKKLYQAGIPVNYGILIDAGITTYQQIVGIEDCGIPILCMITAHHKILSEYKGKKYLICQEGYGAAEQYAAENGYETYRSGGSVTTTALELGIRFGCERIVFVGLDLAYTGGKYHASGTALDHDMQEGNTRLVEDVNGEQVLTGKNLDIYRKWIENRIAEEKNGIFIDATEGGAKVKGCSIQKLSEVIR